MTNKIIIRGFHQVLSNEEAHEITGSDNTPCDKVVKPGFGCTTETPGGNIVTCKDGLVYSLFTVAVDPIVVPAGDGPFHR